MSTERRQDYKKIQGLITQAILSTKKENSGLVKDFNDKIDKFGKHFVKIDTLLEGMIQRLDVANHKAASHEKRINTLDNWKNYIMGGLAVVVLILVPILFMFISTKIENTKVDYKELENMVIHIVDENYNTK